MHHATAGQERPDSDRPLEAAADAQQVDGTARVRSVQPTGPRAEIEDVREPPVVANRRSARVQPGRLQDVRLEGLEQPTQMERCVDRCAIQQYQLEVGSRAAHVQRACGVARVHARLGAGPVDEPELRDAG